MCAEERWWPPAHSSGRGSQSPRLWRMRGFLRIPVMSCSWTSATPLIALTAVICSPKSEPAYLRYQAGWRAATVLNLYCILGNTIQQGDPLGPLCFALTLHSIVERLKRDVPNLTLGIWMMGPCVVQQKTWPRP